jgi:diadenosine tetraphosphate (Ap4A) HIT family hydrolase
LAPDDVRARFDEKFRLGELTVHTSDDWTLSVRPVQPVLGALVLSTRHAALDFSQVPATAAGEMLGLLARAEVAARELFAAVRLNVLCLMMQDPLFHFHLLPRYGAAVEFAGGTWVDTGWPGPPNLADSQASQAGQLDELVRAYAARPWS